MAFKKLFFILPALFFFGSAQAFVASPELESQIKVAIGQGLTGIPADFSFKEAPRLQDYSVDVVYLQLVLKSEKLFCSKCRITGYFGLGTKQALSLFQKKYNVAGSFALAKLNQVLGRPVIPPAVAGASDVLPSCQTVAPTAPLLEWPLDNAIKLPLSLELRWQPPLSWGQGCPDGKRYRLQIDDQAGFEKPLVDVLLQDSQTAYAISSGQLKANNIYHWRVRAENALFSSWAGRDFGVSFSPGVDLRVNDLHGPVTVNYNNSVTLSWAAVQADGCEASGDWSGTKELSGTEKTENLTSSKSFVLTCSGQGGEARAEVLVEVLPLPTLFLEAFVSIQDQDWQESLRAKIPLDEVNVRLETSGNALGLISYRVDCENDGVWDQSLNRSAEASQTFLAACRYPSLGTHQLKARVEKAGLSAEQVLSIVARETDVADLAVVKLSQSAGRLSLSVFNRGPAFDQSTVYYWLKNNVAQVRGIMPGLKTGQSLDFSFPIASGQTVKFLADAEGQLTEAFENNNSLEVLSP